MFLESSSSGKQTASQVANTSTRTYSIPSPLPNTYPPDPRWIKHLTSTTCSRSSFSVSLTLFQYLQLTCNFMKKLPSKVQ